MSPAESIPSLGGGGRDGSGWKKMSWGAVVEGGPTTHDAATLSAPLKVPYLLICISKQAADNFKVSTPMRPDAGMDLCLSMCAGMCVCECVSAFIYQRVCCVLYHGNTVVRILIFNQYDTGCQWKLIITFTVVIL